MRWKSTLIVFLAMLAFSFTHAQNTALSFNAANSDTVATSAMIVPTAGDFTVEFWFNIPSAGVSGQLMEFVSQGVGMTNGFYIGTDGDNGQLRAGDAFIATGVTPPLNQWVHLALTKAGGTATLFLNGVQMAQKTGYSISSTGDNFKVGNQFGGLTEYLTGTIDQLRIWSAALSQAQIKQTMYGSVDPASPGLVADYEMNDGSGSTMTNATATTGLDGTLGASPSNPAWVSSPVQFGDNSMNFDGVDDQMIAPPNAAFDISSGTIEAEINPAVLDATNREIVGNRSGGNTRYSFHVSSTAVGVWNGTTFGTWDTAGVATGIHFTIPTNAWTQLSWVSDGTNITLYVNGSSVGSIVEPLGSATNMTFDVGVSKNAGVDAEFFQGSIDEVRVWNTQQTPTQINQLMGKTLVGNEPGLNALFSFDQGIAGGDNTGLITAVDNTINSNNGTLMNFTLSGATSNFAPSPLFPLPVNFTAFTAVRSGSVTQLKWQTAQEQNSHDFSIEHSTDGSSYTSIGDLPAAGTSTKPSNYSFVDQKPALGLNYYRLKETDLDGHSMYSQIRSVTFATGDAQKIAWYITNGTNVEVNLLNGSNEFYTLSSIDGRTIRKGQFSAGKIYLSGLESGIYIVNATTFNGQQLVAKVLIP